MTTMKATDDRANSTKTKNEHEEFETFLEEVEKLSLKFSDNKTSSHYPPDEGNPCRKPVVDDAAKKSRCQDYIETEVEAKPLAVAKPRDLIDIRGGMDVKLTVEKQNHHNLPRQVKQNMIRVADENRCAWNEFKKLDLSVTSKGNDNGGDPEKKPKISFQITSEKEKKKKKKKNDAASGGKEITPVGANPPFCWNGDNDKNEHAFSTPKWVLVMDTCCLIQNNGIAPQNLIDLANQTFSARYMADKQHANGKNHAAIVATSVEEPIEIVVPHKVWSELEFQSKSQDSRTSYFARTAIRMLRDELTKSGSNGFPGNGCGSVIRSQSLLQSREASSKFLSLDWSSVPTNDDHILACALMEHDHWRASGSATTKSGKVVQAGGVVLVTTDGNLSCKALANDIKVYSPSGFQEYYIRRMESLRKRAVQSLTGSALRM